MECLADDVQVKPDLRDEVLEKLARLLTHPAPQVFKAALSSYDHLSKSRCCEPALLALKRILAQKGDDLERQSFKGKHNFASALVKLGDRDAAWPLVESLELSSYGSGLETKRLRFEGWSEQAADYLLALQADRHSYFGIGLGPDLAHCTLGPVSVELALRTLGIPRLLALLQKLITRVKDKEDLASLRWISVLASGDTSSEALADLIGSDEPVAVRCLAAGRLCETDRRPLAVATLRNIVETEHEQAAEAAQELLAAGEMYQVNLSLILDIALLPDHEQAAQAVATLLQAGEEIHGLSAAFHLLAFCQSIEDRDAKLWMVVESLLKHGRSIEGQAAARWLALRPGFSYRYEACEALLESGCVRETIQLLQYIAYELHDEESQRACQRLLGLREAERVVPLLACVAKAGSPDLRYQASLALALANGTDCEYASSARVRLGFKLAILQERTKACEEALRQFCQIGLRALETIGRSDSEKELLALGRHSLKWLARATDAAAETALIASSSRPVLRLCAAFSSLRAGQVDRAEELLTEMMMWSGIPISAPVRLKVVESLGSLALSQNASLIIRALGDVQSAVRSSAACALRGLGDTAAVQPLIAALGDAESAVRSSAAHALGGLGDPAAVQPLIATLSDAESVVRSSAASALGSLDDAAAVQPLIAALGDVESDVRSSAAYALRALDDTAAVQPLIAALGDAESAVRSSAAHALGGLGDPAAVQPLIAALGDVESNVRSSAASALGNLDDAVAVQPLIAALGDARSDVRSSAASALGWLDDPVAVQPLIAALGDAKSDVRSSAAYALGWLDDPAAVEPLIAALGDVESNVRSSAATALGWSDDPAAVQPLIAALGDVESNVRSSAATALGWLDDPAAVQPLIAALGDAESAVRSSAASALGELSDRAAVWPLITTLGDAESDVRSSAASALGALGDRAAVQPLITVLGDAESAVRSSAVSALGELGDRAAVQTLIATLSDADSTVRSSAASALGRLSAAEASTIIESTSIVMYDWDGQAYVKALVHLEPVKALSVLARYGQQFCREAWVDRLRGFALSRMGDPDSALVNFKQAEAKDSEDIENLLACAHFFIEQDDLPAAEDYIKRAASIAPRGRICRLSQAVWLWQMRNREGALEALQMAQRDGRQIAKPQILRYEDFWGPKAVAALEAMVACA